MTCASEKSEILNRLTRELFQNAPGDLPEILVSPLQPDAICEGYSLLFNHDGYLVGKPSLYDPEKKMEVPLDRIEDPAGMVVAGVARPFHFLIRNFRIASIELPEIGVLILANGIALDYEQSDEWQEPQVEAFCSLLTRLRQLTPEAEITLEHHLPQAIRDDLVTYVDLSDNKLQDSLDTEMTSNED